MRDKFPERTLGLVCRKGLGDFFLKTGVVDVIFEIKKGDRASYQQVREQVRKYSEIYVYCPHSSFRTALFVRSLRPKDSVGFSQSWNRWAFKRRVGRPQELPDVLRQLSLLVPEDEVLAENLHHYQSSKRAYARDEDGRISGVPPWASISLRAVLARDRTSWSRLMERLNWGRWDGASKALLFPGSVWATKRWTEEGFAQVGRKLTELGGQILIMGAGNEVALCERLAAQIPGAVSLAGQTSLYESALILLNSDLMIGNDSASVHLAAVTETPSIAIFGPTTIEQGFRPWSNQAWIVDKPGLSCRPCGPHGHHRCPRGTHECMKHVSPGDVMLPAISLLP